MPDSVRVGIVGLGGISRAIHLPNVTQSPLFTLAAICDVDAVAAEATAQEYSVPRWYVDAGEMYRRAGLDAVIVATPNRTHPPLAIAALEAGLHVLCEKPIALNSADADRMVATARQRKRILMADFQERFWPEVTLLKRFIEAGDLGHIYYAEAVWMRRRGVPPSAIYHNREITGGGPLIDLGVHVVDLVWWLMGNPQPLAVSAATFRAMAERPDLVPLPHENFNPADFTVEDMAVGQIRFADGALMTVKVSWMSEIEKSPPHLLLGDRGGAEFAPRERFILHSQMHGAQVDIVPVIPKESVGRHRLLLDHFGRCVLGMEKPLITGAQMVTGMRVIEAMYRSAEEGRETLLT